MTKGQGGDREEQPEPAIRLGVELGPHRAAPTIALGRRLALRLAVGLAPIGRAALAVVFDAVTTRRLLAGRAARVWFGVAQDVARVAGFAGLDDPVAAELELARGVAAVPGDLTAVITGLAELHRLVAADRLERAGGAAPVSVLGAAVITRFAGFDLPIAAHGRFELTGLVTTVAFEAAAVVALFTRVLFAVAAGLRERPEVEGGLAVRIAGVAPARSVIALLTELLDSVATLGGFEQAGGIAAVTGLRVTVIALLAWVLDAVAATLDDAGRRTAVTGNVPGVVTLLTAVDVAVSAGRRVLELT